MFNKLLNRLIKSKYKVNNPREPGLVVRQLGNLDPTHEIVMHCCAHLTPEGFQKMVGNSRLDFMIWYKALWIIQHNPRIKENELMEELDISWPSAQMVKKRVLRILPH